MITEIRNMIATLISITMAYFSPINDMVFVLFYLFLLNMIAGMLTGMVVDDEDFSLKKFFHCLLETLALYTIVLSVFLVGEKMDNKTGAVQCISGIVYSSIYFYSVNILRNLRKLLPNFKIIAFLYYVVSFEFVKKVPYLQAFQEKEKELEK